MTDGWVSGGVARGYRSWQISRITKPVGGGGYFLCDVPRTTFFARSAEDFENLEKHHKLI